jgi:hypothetical protein
MATNAGRGRAPPHSIHSASAPQHAAAALSMPTHARPVKAAPVISNGAVRAPSSRGSQRAMFLQLTSRVHEEVSQQKQQLHAAIAELDLRCNGMLRGSAPGSSDERGDESTDHSNPQRSVAPTFNPPSQTFHFEPAAPALGVLSQSLAKLYSEVQHAQQDGNTEWQLVAEVTVDETSPAPEPLKVPAVPLRHAPPDAQPQQPATPIRTAPVPPLLGEEKSDANSPASVSARTNGSQAPSSGSTPAVPTVAQFTAVAPAFVPVPSSAFAAANQFPALQRAADYHASLQTSPVDAAQSLLDKFPSLSRALQLRQARLNAPLPASASGSAVASHATAGSSFDAVVAAAKVGDPHSESVSVAPHLHHNGMGVEFNAVQSRSILSPEEKEQRSVRDLLRQQALNFLLDQMTLKLKQSMVSRNHCADLHIDFQSGMCSCCFRVLPFVPR